MPWQFNRKIAPLAVLDIEIFNWGVAYQYPVDCLSILRLVGEQEQVEDGVHRRTYDELHIEYRRSDTPYEVFNFDNNKVIGCNSTNMRIDYAAKVENPDLFSDDFILALSHLLASELAIPIVGAEQGRALRSDSLSLYNEYLTSAMASDHNDHHNMTTESEFVTIRN